jgi:hypothetical protein
MPSKCYGAKDNMLPEKQRGKLTASMFGGHAKFQQRMALIANHKGA